MLKFFSKLRANYARLTAMPVNTAFNSLGLFDQFSLKNYFWQNHQPGMVI